VIDGGLAIFSIVPWLNLKVVDEDEDPQPPGLERNRCEDKDDVTSGKSAEVNRLTRPPPTTPPPSLPLLRMKHGDNGGLLINQIKLN